jgi:hypothetical protein
MEEYDPGRGLKGVVMILSVLAVAATLMGWEGEGGRPSRGGGPFVPPPAAALVRVDTRVSGEVATGVREHLRMPRAVMDCSVGRSWMGGVWVSGQESVDPTGEGLAYHWRVISAPETPHPMEFRVSDLGHSLGMWNPFAGQYRFGLRVEDSLGRVSAETICDMRRRHPARLAVELSWPRYEGSADLDLHLVQGWADLFDIPGDLHYDNYRDGGWDGDMGTVADNCVLGFDARGTGDYAGPGEVAYCWDPMVGVIDVVVHEYFRGPPEADEEPVMVRIWLDNRLIYDTLEQRPSTEWWVARVDLKTNTAIRLDPPVESPE